MTATRRENLRPSGRGGVQQNEYDIREEKVTITGGAQPLHGVLAWPKRGRGPYGLVVFVHGDGPIDATHDTFYRPIWESMAQAGYASLSWDKPGVNGAPGNWLHQSMQERADETIAAINWAKTRPGIDRGRIGLWGASQAGWVMPKVAGQTPDARFIIAVGTTINWLQQGRYNLLAELDARHASKDEITATDLAAVKVPVLLVLGDRDINVDVADTEAGYRRQLRIPGQLQVRRYPEATHALVPKDVEDSEFTSTLLGIAAPRSLFVDGYLRDQQRFLESLGH